MAFDIENPFVLARQLAGSIFSKYWCKRRIFSPLVQITGGEQKNSVCRLINYSH